MANKLMEFARKAAIENEKKKKKATTSGAKAAAIAVSKNKQHTSNKFDPGRKTKPSALDFSGAAAVLGSKDAVVQYVGEANLRNSNKNAGTTHTPVSGRRHNYNPTDTSKDTLQKVHTQHQEQAKKGVKQTAKVLDKDTQQRESYKKNLSPIGKMAVDVGYGAGQLVTDIAAGTLLTGGTGGAISGLSKAGRIAGEVIGRGGITKTLASSRADVQEYNKAISEGASDSEARAAGISVAALEYLTESLFGVGSAIKGTLGKGIIDVEKLLKLGTNDIIKSTGGRAVAQSMAKFGLTAGTEGAEEFISGMIQPVLEKYIYSDEELDLGEMLKSSSYQAVIGAILGSGFGGVDVATSMNQGKFLSDKDTVDALVGEGLNSKENTKAYQLAKKVAARMQKGSAPTSLELNQLQRENTIAINQERSEEIKAQKSTNKTIERTVGKEYVNNENDVQDKLMYYSGLRGMGADIDVPAVVQEYGTIRNTVFNSMKEKLDSQNIEGNESHDSDVTSISKILIGQGTTADFVKLNPGNELARVVFQEQTGKTLPGTNAETRDFLINMNENMRVVAANIEKDPSSLYVRDNAVAAYQRAGRFNSPMESVTQRFGTVLSEQEQKAAYEIGKNTAAKEDVKAKTQKPKKNRSTEPSRSETGFVDKSSNHTTTKLAEEYDKFAKLNDFTIIMQDSIKSEDGKAANGYYDPSNRTIVLSKNSTIPMARVLGHEVYHHWKLYAPKQATEFEEFVKKVMFEDDPIKFDNEMKRLAKLYGKNEDEYLFEEFMGDQVPELLADPKLIEKLATENPTLGQKLLDFIKQFIESIKSIFGDTNTGNFFESYGIKEEALDMLAATIKAAKENPAAVEETNNIDSKRFSLQDTVETKGGLIAVHNLDESALSEALRLRGLPMPSIAIVTPEVGHDNFGPISVVLGKSTVDPKNKDNKVYDADAWTPTFPAVGYKYDSTKINKAIRKVLDINGGGEDWYNVKSYLYEDNITTERGANTIFDGIKHNRGIKAAFLAENKIPYKKVMQPKRYQFETGEMDALIKKYGMQQISEWSQMRYDEIDDSVYMKIIDSLNQWYSDTMGKKVELYKRDNFHFGKFDTLMQSIMQYHKQGKDLELDNYKTGDNIDAAIKKHNEQYEDWGSKLFNGTIIKKGIKKPNVDWFTPSGNRKSFEGVYMEYTLDNIVKAMRAETTQGAFDTYGAHAGAVKGVLAKQFKSVSEIKKDSWKLKDAEESRKEYDRITTELTNLSMSLVDEYISKHPNENQFIIMDNGGAAIMDAARTTGTPAAIKRVFDEYSEITYTNETLQEVVDLFQEIRNLPVQLFEAKPRRAVGLDEIQLVVLPKNTSKDLVSELQSKNIPVDFYDESKDGDRIAKVNSHDEIRWSLQDSEGNSLTPAQAEFFKDSKVRDEQNDLIPVYHGTQHGGFMKFMQELNDRQEPGFWFGTMDVASSYTKSIKRFNTNKVKTMTDAINRLSKMDMLLDITVHEETGFEVKWNNKKDGWTWLPAKEEYNEFQRAYPNGLDSNLEMSYSIRKLNGEPLHYDAENEKEFIDVVNHIFEDYAEKDIGNLNGVYKVYLNLKNPLVINSNGQNWNSISEEGLEYTLSDIEVTANNGTIEISIDATDEESWTGETHKIKVQSYEDITSALMNEFDGLGRKAATEISSNIKTKLANNNAVNNSTFSVYGDYPIMWTGEMAKIQKTRDWVKEAHDNGNDGVIFRNIKDHGGIDSRATGEGDVYVAFNSNQIKSVDNQNPTEDDDIRYQLQEQADTDKLRIRNKIDELKTLLAQEKLSEKGMLPDSLAMSKLVKQLRADYKSEISINKTGGLVDELTQIYVLLKSKGNNLETVYEKSHELAKAIVSQGGELTNTETEKEYRALKEYMRTTPIKIEDIYKGDFGKGDFNRFRKSMFGKLKLSNEGETMDSLYKDEILPMFTGLNLNPDLTHATDILNHILEIMDELEPVFDTFDIRSEAGRQLVDEATIDILDGMFGMDPQKPLSANQRRNKYTNILESIEKSTNEYADKTAQQKAADKAKYQKMLSDLEVSEANRRIEQKKTYDRLFAELKSERDEQLKLTKLIGEAKLKKQEEIFRKRLENTKARFFERRTKSELMDSIKRNADFLAEALIHPTDTKHIPEGQREAIAEMLSGLDFESTHTDAWEERMGTPGKRIMRLRKLAAEYQNIISEMNNEEDVSIEADANIAALLNILAKSVEMRDESGKVINDKEGNPQIKRLSDLDNEELSNVRIILKHFRHIVSTANKTFNGRIKETYTELGEKIIREMDEKKRAKGYVEWRNDIVEFFSKDTVTPADFFAILGGTSEKLYYEVRKGFDQHVNNITVAMEYLDKVTQEISKSDVKSWSEKHGEAKTHKLSNGKEIKLLPSQVMSIYALNKREQARNHLYVGGMVIAPLTVKKGLTHEQLVKTRIRVSQEDVGLILASMTDDQKSIADKLLQFITSTPSEWGNETSMTLYGYRKFTEPNYFPIQSSKEWYGETFEDRGDSKIKNFSGTKKTIPHANNPIVIDDFFKVVTDHINKMSMYNALVPALTDFERVYNYVSRDGSSPSNSVKDSIMGAFGEKGNAYITKMMKNINGYYNKEQGLKSLDRMLSAFKKSALGLNMRVLVQQPTSLVRSAMLIDHRYILDGMAQKTIGHATRKEMWDHVPIARWKSWGYAQTDVSREQRDIMMGKTNWLDTVTMGAYGFADDISWTVLYAAVKAETKDKNPELEYDTPEYWEHIVDRFNHIVDRTQVVDSVFHRADIMRDKTFGKKMITSFMPEPIKMYNMLRTQIILANRLRNEGQTEEAVKMYARIGTTMVPYFLILTVAQSLLDALRRTWTGDDDDDEKTYLELFKKHFTDNLIDNINPMTWFPILRDIWSAIEGYEVKQPALSNAVTFIGDTARIYNYYFGDSKDSYNVLYLYRKLIEDGLSLKGIPLKNFLRESESFELAIRSAFGYKEYAIYLKNKRKFNVSENESKFIDIYLKAAASGSSEDAQMIYDDLKKAGITEKAIINRIKKNYSEVLKQSIEDGLTTTATQTIDQMVALGMPRSEIEGTVTSKIKEDYMAAFESQDETKIEKYNSLLKSAGWDEDDIYGYEVSMAKGYGKLQVYQLLQSDGWDAAYQEALYWTEKYPDMYARDADGMMYGIDGSADSTKASWDEGKWTN